MKILVIAHDSTLYGASQSLLTLLKDWKEQKNAELLVLLPYYGRIEEKLDELGIENKIVSFPRCVYAYEGQSFVQRLSMCFGYSLYLRVVEDKLDEIIENFKPQVIYTNTSVVKIGNDLCRKHKIPHVWHIREFGWEDYKLNYVPSRVAIQRQIKKAHSIFISHSLQQYWHAANNSNSYLIYNGLVKRDAIGQQRKIKGGQMRVGILGAIMPGKGQATAIQAINLLKEEYPEISLAIYGNAFDQSYYEEIKSLCEKNNLENRVSINGFTEDIELVYSNLDILLSCSEKEAFGRSIVEAMGKGIPVVANNAGGVPEIIEHNKDGLLYSKGAEELAAQLKRLISDNALYEHLSANAIKKVLAHYTIEKYSNAVFGVLEKVIND